MTIKSLNRQIYRELPKELQYKFDEIIRVSNQIQDEKVDNPDATTENNIVIFAVTGGIQDSGLDITSVLIKTPPFRFPVTGNNYFEIDEDGNIRFYGNTEPTKILPLPIARGGGTVTISAITGAPSIDFDIDGDLVYVSFKVPDEWDSVSDLIIKAMVQNEIDETDGDDVSFTATVHGIGDGETNADAGQTVEMLLDLTGGDEAINEVNLVTGTIVHDDGSYPISPGDSVIAKVVVNLGGAGECTGPLHIIDWWVEINTNKIGG